MPFRVDRGDDHRDAHDVRAGALVHPRAAEEADRPGRAQGRPREPLKSRRAPRPWAARSSCSRCCVPDRALGRPTNAFVLATMAVTAGYGVIGYVDDYLKIKHKSSGGLAGRYKLFWQFVVGGAVIGLHLLASSRLPADWLAIRDAPGDPVLGVLEAPDHAAALALRAVRGVRGGRHVQRREPHRRARRPRHRPGDDQRRARTSSGPTSPARRSSSRSARLVSLAEVPRHPRNRVAAASSRSTAAR